MKNYTQAPLPFQGQKRRFLKQFREALQEFPSDAIYVDLFGGSGLLSHTVKQFFPGAKVIYNDFDNYAQRIENVAKTNALIGDIRYILQNENRKERLSDEKHSEIVNRISVEKGFIDWITVSSNVLFSMNYVSSIDELKKERLYNKVRLSDYNAEDYLDGVDVVKMDYQELFNQYKEKNVVFLIDPPYLSTDTTTYSKEDYWRLKDYLNVLNCLKEMSYFYFTSNKSQIVELCEWMENQAGFKSPFYGSTIKTVAGTASYNTAYEDIMIYKLNK